MPKVLHEKRERIAQPPGGPQRARSRDPPAALGDLRDFRDDGASERARCGSFEARRGYHHGEALARSILRNSQTAVRSAKQTILD